jgi:hypothetical protein
VQSDARVELHALERSLQEARRWRCERLLFHRRVGPLTVPDAFSLGERVRERYEFVSPVLLRADTRDCFDTVTLEGGTVKLQREGTTWARGDVRQRIADDVWSRPCVRPPDDSLSTLDVSTLAAAAAANGYVLAIAPGPAPD